MLVLRLRWKRGGGLRVQFCFGERRRGKGSLDFGYGWKLTVHEHLFIVVAFKRALGDAAGAV